MKRGLFGLALLHQFMPRGALCRDWCRGREEEVVIGGNSGKDLPEEKKNIPRVSAARRQYELDAGGFFRLKNKIQASTAGHYSDARRVIRGEF